MKHKMKLLPLAVAGALFSAGAAHAEGFSFNGGYFRAGPAFGADKGHDRTCYQAPGSEWKYRLGNECDYYGEFMLSYGAGKADETQYNIYWMPNFYNGGVSAGDTAAPAGSLATTVHVEQLYGEIKAPDFAKNTTFWAGSRFYGRQNGNQVDTFFVNMSGTGGGADIDLGGGMKLGLAFFRSDGFAAPTSFTAASSTGQPGTRVNVDLNGVPAGPNNALRFTGTYTKGDFSGTATTPGGTSGTAFSVQDGLAILGGHNFAWLQYAEGSAYLNQNFNGFSGSGLSGGSDVKHWRIADSLDFQATPVFGGEAFAAYQEDKCGTSCSATSLFQGTLKHMSVGFRPAIGLTQNFKLQGEVSFDSVKPGSGVLWNGAPVGTENMTKFTIAPTVAMGPTYWARPEIRFYVTTAHWNSGTNNAFNLVNSTTTGYGDLGGKTNGTSYGIQIEAWW
ncbi:MAG TPA: carbohydrate porin [Burkholderiaceae bacterium]|nr:carbohydrate porin [Burkholderiaceae bacterium]